MITYSFQKKNKLLNKHFKDNIKQTLDYLLKEHHKTLKKIHYHFCDDDSLLAINRNSLNHDFYTDIITFDYSEKNQVISEIFISLDRVEENAINYQVDFLNELVRVMLHGVLHCIGYNDLTEEDETMMRKIEDKYISYFFSLDVPRGTSVL